MALGAKGCADRRDARTPCVANTRHVVAHRSSRGVLLASVADRLLLPPCRTQHHMDEMSALEVMARIVLLFILVSVPWWVGGALLGAVLPRGKVGWYVRTAFAVAGALTILLAGWVAWWLVVEFGGAGRAITSRWECGTIVANVAAVFVAMVLLIRRRRSDRTHAESGTAADR